MLIITSTDSDFPVLNGYAQFVVLYQFQKLLEIPEKVYEAASDCICSSIFVCEDSSYSSFAMMLQGLVLELLPVFSAAVQAEDYFRCVCVSVCESVCAVFYLEISVFGGNMGQMC